MRVATNTAPPAAAAPAETVKLLLVDDDRDTLLALQAILEPLNQELMLAESGKDALRMCLDHNIAAILLDVRMPEMDGFETAELIRSRKRSRHTPILFLTAYRSDEQLFRGYDLGAVDFLFKPIVPEILQSKVSVFVELSRSEQILRRQAEEIARTEEQFRAVLEGAPDAMVITTGDGAIELANSRVDALFGHARADLIRRNIRTLIPGWEPDGRAAQAETRMTAIRQDGSSFPAQITRNPFSTRDGRFLTTAIRDASDQVRGEARIQQINLELERRVAQRTAALTYSNEALRQFAWAASHDLQEPIRTVLSYSQWLAEVTQGMLGSREGQMLDVIQQQASRLHRLLGALQQYIQVAESGESHWNLVNCNAAVETAVSNLRGMIEESGATVRHAPLPSVLGTDIMLVQLFQNLISNGIKYRRAEEAPRISISAEPCGDGWTYSVEDNGTGVDPKYREYVFGVFKRLEGGQHAGTGMGLAICKAVVERLGGRIWIADSPGPGALFQFSLPGKVKS